MRDDEDPFGVFDVVAQPRHVRTSDEASKESAPYDDSSASAESAALRWSGHGEKRGHQQDPARMLFVKGFIASPFSPTLF